MSVEKVLTTVDVGSASISVRYVDQDGKRTTERRQPNQGISIRVSAEVDGNERQVLRFDCLDCEPHYHYGPENGNERVLIDKVTAGNPVGWSLEQLRARLPAMVRRGGYDALADSLEDDVKAGDYPDKLAEVEAAARDAAIKWRRTVTHNGSKELAEIPGSEVIEAGNIRFGLEFRDVRQLGARGMAIHVLSDVAGQEIELVAFDCFDKNAHYHYGPRNRDFRHYWDRTVVPNPLRWVLDRLKEGKLAQMIETAGYPSIAAELDEHLISHLMETQIEPKALAIEAANA